MRSPLLRRAARCFALAALLLLGACAASNHRNYSAEAINAWVIDNQTGKPLEGVVVVASWVLMRGTVGGRSRIGPIMTLEAVTDANGRFFFPAWGPVHNETAGFLDHEDPELTLFKAGYQLISLTNDYRVDFRDKPSKRKSESNGRKILLQRFDGSDDKYAEYLANAGNRLILMFEWHRNCNMNRTPMLAQALDRENSRLENHGLRKGGFTFRRNAPQYMEKCGLPSRGADK